MRRRARIATLAGVLSILLALLGAADALAQATPADAGAQVSLSATTRKDRAGHEVPGQRWVTAKVVGADGKPLSSREVAFYQATDFFGPRRAYVDTATTDAAGEATVIYEAATPGKQTIVGKLVGQTAEGSTTATVAQPGAGFEADPLPLAGVREWLPWALAAVVLATWAVLAITFVGAIRGIRGAPSALAREEGAIEPDPSSTHAVHAQQPIG